jgi:serine/threonine-protein kinase
VAPKDAFPKARAAAEKALEIDPHLSEARTVLAGIRSFYEWDPAGGESQARAAIELDPKYPRARQVLSECLTASRRNKEAIAEVKLALDLDPLSLHMNAAVALTCYCSRQYKEATEYGLRTVELDPNFFPGYFYLGLTYAAQGQHPEAVTALKQATALSGNSTLMLGALGGAFASWGKEDEARKMLHELQELARRKYVSQVFVAAIHAGLGENGPALDCLERAYEERCPWLVRCLVADQRLDPLRDDERFRSLLSRVGAAR